jgi:hypothetical protein
MATKTCLQCGKQFETTTPQKFCCSAKCAKSKWAKEKGPKYFRDLYKSDPDYFKAQTKAHNKRIKDKCFEAYGGYVCACCGVTGELFCNLDHINNDGASHRKEMNLTDGSTSTYRWAIKNGFPPIFQVLCWNCNCAKNLNGGVCPHKDVNYGN